MKVISLQQAREYRSSEGVYFSRIWGILWRTAFGLALALTSGELICRQLFFSPSVFDKQAGWGFAPGATVVCRTEGAAKGHWDEHGVRRSRTSGGSNERPILVLGDSFTEALQVDDAAVYTAQVEQLISKAGIARRVINVSKSGNSLADYVANAAHYRQLFDPIWTVVQIGDLDCVQEAWDGSGASFMMDPVEKSLRIKKASYLDPRDRGLLRTLAYEASIHSALFAYSLKRSQDLKEWWLAEPPMFNASGAKPRGRITERKDYPIEGELEMLRGAYSDRLTILYTTPFYSPTLSQPASEVDARLKAFARSKRISVIWLSDMYKRMAEENAAANGFANTRPFKGHWNETGHKEIAELLAAELIRIRDTNGVF